jgi:hypothetical protein
MILGPEAQYKVKDGKIVAGVDLESLKYLLESEHASIRSLFGVDEVYQADSKTLMGMDQPLNLSMFFKVTSPRDRLAYLTGQLRKFSIVQAAYLKPGAYIAGVSEPDELDIERSAFTATPRHYTHLQEYLRPAAEGGIDAQFAWDQDGGRGRGIKVIDVEGAWNFEHEDLVANPSTCEGGVSIANGDWRSHGTAVLGMLAGDHNQFGIKGICPEAKVCTVSIFDRPDADTSVDWGSARAIKTAADKLNPGDILLIELHRPGPAVNFEQNDQTQEGYIPIEWWPCDMAAILYATTVRRVLVVEAGGNGQQDLSDRIYNVNPKAPHGPFPFWWVNPFKRRPIDPKAILVGAGVPPCGTHGSNLGPDRSRAGFSNFGRMMDTQGWGEEVATCGGNNDLGSDLDAENVHYTRRFRGTSSAAAMVAGVLCCLQGVLKTKHKSLRPLEARRLLRDRNLGSQQQDGPFGPAHLEPIGPRPDLRKLIRHF